MSHRFKVTEDATAADVLVCRRVADMPKPATDAFIGKCALCREPVWIALSSPPEPKRVCLGCCAALIETNAPDRFQVGVTPKQNADYQRTLARKKRGEP